MEPRPSDADATPIGDARDPGTVARAINELAWALANELPAGEVAELRRAKPADPACGAFYKIVALHLDPLLPVAGAARDEAERRWGAILSGMALMQDLHRPGRRLGHALAAAGFSELRFVRLLRAHDDALGDAVRLTARFLAAKGEPVDWVDLAWLVLSDGSEAAEGVRRHAARDFYGALAEAR
jgi:CRISPR system Cascade subunit CasB